MNQEIGHQKIACTEEMRGHLFTSGDPIVGTQINNITNHKPQTWIKLRICGKFIQPVEVDIINAPGLLVFIKLFANSIKELTYSLNIFFCWTDLGIMP